MPAKTASRCSVGVVGAPSGLKRCHKGLLTNGLTLDASYRAFLSSYWCSCLGKFHFKGWSRESESISAKVNPLIFLTDDNCRNLRLAIGGDNTDCCTDWGFGEAI